MARTIAFIALLLLATDAPARTTASDAQLIRTVVALAQLMSINASAMHPERNAALIPDTDRVVYVSNGYPIRGRDYLRTLSETYATRKSQRLRWTKWEVTPIGKDAAVFTGWATMTEESHGGVKKTGRYIFTEVFAKTDAGWKRVIAQKSPLDEG